MATGTGKGMANRALGFAMLALGFGYAHADDPANTQQGAVSTQQAQTADSQPPVRSWVLIPTLQLSETYTDNLTLAPTNRLSDFISSIMPGFTFRQTGNRTKATLDYGVQGLFYRNQSQLDHYYSHLDASGTAEIIKKTFFVDAGASVMQQPLSFAGAYGASLSNATGNIINISSSSLSPYLVHRFGEIATGEVRFTHTIQNYSQGGPSTTGNAYLGGLYSSTSDSTAASLNGGSAFNNLLWGMNYNDTVIQYGGMPETRLMNYSANMGYLFTPKFKVILTGGYEKDSYVYIGPQPQSVYWKAETDWAPTSHTKFMVSVGHRFFGNTRSLTVNQVTRLTTFQASYNEDVTSTILQQTIPTSSFLDQLLQAQIPNGAARQQAVQSLIASLGGQALLGQNVITNQVYLAKTFNASMGINLPRSIMILTAFNTKSSSLEPGNALLPNIANYGAVNEQGGTASWNWQFSPHLSSHFNASLTSMVFPGQTLNENFKLLNVGLTEQLARHLNGDISYRHQTMIAPAYLNYTENAFIATLNYAN